MFGEQFYPTPKHVIKMMLEPYRGTIRRGGYNSHTGYPLENMAVLDPECGSCAILDYIQEANETSRRDGPKLYGIEIDPNLRAIAQSKKYRIIHDDFLTYTGDYLFDLIVMNPPFADGDKHLLKAWDIMERGDIVCLLNSETILNPFSQSRQLIAELIAQYGSVEHIGKVFTDAERTTDVSCCIVRLKKTAKSRLEFDFQNVTREKTTELNEETFKDAVATNDVIGNMILQFTELKKFFVEYMKVRDGLRFYSAGLLRPDSGGILKLAEEAMSETNPQSFNKFNDLVKQEIWTEVMKKTNVEKYMTHAVRQNFQEFTKAQGCLDFTKENVANLVEMIFNNRHRILEKAIGDVFDMFTQFHKENRCYVEGWKTNDKYKVNKKVILPRWILYGDYQSAYDRKRFGDNLKPNYSKSSQYSDIDKVLCYLTGTSYETCNTLYKSLEEHCKEIGNVKTGETFNGKGESTFFKYTLFRKGTLHIEFKDLKLWEEFNLRACAGKQWLPSDEQRKYEQRHSQQPKDSVLMLSQN